VSINKDGLNFLNIEDKPVPAPEPPRPPANPTVVMVAALVAFVSLLVRFQSAGWFIILFAIPYLVICVIHVLVHWKASRYPTLLVRSLIIASDVLLFIAFMLQWDIGDNEHGWLAITALFSPPSTSPAPAWWPDGGLMNILLFIPELVILVTLFWLSRREADRLEAAAWAS
jgi:hypothetical protein